VGREDVIDMASFAERFTVKTRCELMSQDDKKRIHEATLEILEDVGVRVHSPMARQALKQAGAIMDGQKEAVRFPVGVVNSLLKKVPRTFTLAGRTKEFDLPLDGTHCYFTTDGCGVQVWDAKTRTRRRSVLEDVRKTAVVSDFLPFVSIYEPMVVAHDVPEKSHVVKGVQVAMENTSKHILTESTSTPEEARAQVQMAAKVVGSVEELRKRHYISAMVCTVSPLALEGPTTEAAMVWAENHVPVHITGMAQAGMTGPASIPGDLVVNHAETLALACAMQAHAPGCPLMYGSVLSAMDPRTGAYIGGSPESTILCAAAVEMAKFCKIPNSTGGMGSSAKVPGVQASIENTVSSMTSALVGGEVVNGLGVPDGSTLLSYEQLLFDHEIAGMTLKAYSGIDVTEETLAIDLIKKVGIGGTYLGQKHTLAHMRDYYVQLMWQNESFDRLVQKGGMDSLEAANERIDGILKEHTPEPLDADVSKAVAAVVRDFGKS
jgi:trimethylamine--corrinoid protein Co-methyltransferase